jgi:hypothetical protein
MTTLTLDPKYVDILRAFGSLEEAVEEAVHRYALERINERVEKLQGEILAFEAKYGMSYEQFYTRIMTDDEFVENLWNSNPIWKVDFDAWEYYVEGLSEWLERLEKISKS